MKRLPTIPEGLASDMQARRFVNEVLAVQTGDTIADLAGGASDALVITKVNDVLAKLRDAGVIKE